MFSLLGKPQWGFLVCGSPRYAVRAKAMLSSNGHDGAGKIFPPPMVECISWYYLKIISKGQLHNARIESVGSLAEITRVDANRHRHEEVGAVEEIEKIYLKLQRAFFSDSKLLGDAPVHAGKTRSSQDVPPQRTIDPGSLVDGRIRWSHNKQRSTIAIRCGKVAIRRTNVSVYKVGNLPAAYKGRPVAGVSISVTVTVAENGKWRAAAKIDNSACGPPTKPSIPLEKWEIIVKVDNHSMAHIEVTATPVQFQVESICRVYERRGSPE
jgi:hypothetical protein